MGNINRTAELEKRIERLETQYQGIYESACDMAGRLRVLENQTLWNQPVEAIGRAVRSERDADDAGPSPKMTIHMFGDDVELEEQLRDGKKKISRYAMKELKQRLKRK